MKVTIVTNAKLIEKKMENAVDEFKRLESDCLDNVDILKCIDDYVRALFIYDTRLVTVKSPD